MMARLVRPRVAKPEQGTVQEARRGDKELLSKFHQGQKQCASHKVRMYGCNLCLLKIID
jgi:hypothetical protein